jgi:hypothetical protein
MIPTNAYKFITISFYTQRIATSYGQPYGSLQGYKIQRLDKYV